MRTTKHALTHNRTGKELATITLPTNITDEDRCRVLDSITDGLAFHRIYCATWTHVHN